MKTVLIAIQFFFYQIHHFLHSRASCSGSVQPHYCALCWRVYLLTIAEKHRHSRGVHFPFGVGIKPERNFRYR